MATPGSGDHPEAVSYDQKTSQVLKHGYVSLPRTAKNSEEEEGTDKPNSYRVTT